MIKTGFKYTCFTPKKTKSDKTYFSIQDFNKEKPTEKNYATVFCDNEVELYDRCKAVIVEIKSVGISQYNGKQQTSIFATVQLDGSEVDNHLKEMSGNKIVEIDNDSLPF